MVLVSYDVVDETGKVLASEMSLEVALCLIKGLFEQYFNEQDLRLMIRRHNYE